MKFNLSNPYDLTKFKGYVCKLAEKKCYCEVKELKHQRTSSQNSYLHLLLAMVAIHEGCSLTFAKEKIYKKLNADIYRKMFTDCKGVEHEDTRSSAELDTTEMAISIKRLQHYYATERGLYLPDPNENEHLLWIEKEIERHKEMLYE